MRKLSLIILISVFFTACGAANKYISESGIDREEYKVYSEFLDLKGESAKKGFKLYRDDTKEILINKITSQDIKYESRETLEKEITGCGKIVNNGGLFEDYIEKNLRSHELSEKFLLPVKYKLVKFENYMKDVESGYFEKKPEVEGLFMLKRIGFNEKKDLALMYIRKFYRYQSALGYIVLMEKKDGKWIEKETCKAWKE